MVATFHIKVDPVRAIVRITIGGFFDTADLQSFAARRQAAYTGMAGRRGEHVTLVDASECKIQSQEVFTAFSAMLHEPNRRSRRIAIVTGHSPARLQVRRISTLDTAQFFYDVAAAERWLFAPEARCASATRAKMPREA